MLKLKPYSSTSVSGADIYEQGTRTITLPDWNLGIAADHIIRWMKDHNRHTVHINIRLNRMDTN